MSNYDYKPHNSSQNKNDTKQGASMDEKNIAMSAMKEASATSTATAMQLPGQETQNSDNPAEAAYLAGEAAEYYDPAQDANYYYQDDDGNYYYYADPQLEMVNEDGGSAEIVPTPENLIRSYEYEDWEPPSHGFFVNIVVDTFFCKPFRLYLTLLLYCAGVLIAVMGLNYIFAVLYRLYIPPESHSNKILSVLCYFALFLYLSYAIVSAICVWMDMLKNLWMQRRDDLAFWGMSQRTFSKRKPPYVIYFLIICSTVFLPLFWGLIEAVQSGQSLVFFAQRYANVSVLASVFLVVFCYAWFFFCACAAKYLAIKNRKERDDFRRRESAYKNHPEKMTKKHWYHAQTIVEEFGLDGKTLRYDSLVYSLGGVPIFALYAGHSLVTYPTEPSVVWGAIASLVMVCLYVVGWFSLFHQKGQWSIYAVSFLNVLLFILAMGGASMGEESSLLLVVLLLWIATQCMFTRKRKHSLTRREMCALLKLPLNRELEMEKRPKRIDSYLFCCRNLVLDYLCCFDVKKYFGYRHPDVRAAERRNAITNIALRTDQKALLVWWIIVMFAVAFVIALGNNLCYIFTTNIAVVSKVPFDGTAPNASICQIEYNKEGGAPLKLLDLALLSALSYTYGNLGDADFLMWFTHLPKLIRIYPKHLPPTLDLATDGVMLRFSDYLDTSSNFHFITLNSNMRGMSIFRDMDEWGESISFQIAGAISPLISIWPETYRAAFVKEGAFLKRTMPAYKALKNVQEYIEKLLSKNLQEKILLIGDQFNGGYAKLLSSQYNLSFVAFNPPGTKYKLLFLPKGVQVSMSRGLWSYIDSLEDSSEVVYVACDDTYSSNECTRISFTINFFRNLCGDPQGRGIVDI